MSWTPEKTRIRATRVLRALIYTKSVERVTPLYFTRLLVYSETLVECSSYMYLLGQVFSPTRYVYTTPFCSGEYSENTFRVVAVQQERYGFVLTLEFRTSTRIRTIVVDNEQV